MGPKIIHDVSAEELMKIIEGSDDVVIPEDISEAGKFIYALNIKQGEEKIPAELIYYTYKQWKGWGHKKQPKPQFFKDFKKYFTAHRTTDGMTYFLDPKPFDLSKETYWLIRSEVRNERPKRQKKS